MPRRPKRPKRAQRANRPKWPDCPPPRVNLDDDEYVGKRDFANAREAKAVKRAVEQIVKDTWKQVGGLSRMILARAGGDITVRKADALNCHGIRTRSPSSSPRMMARTSGGQRCTPCSGRDGR